MNKQELIENLETRHVADVFVSDSFKCGFNTMKGIAIGLANSLDEPIEPQAEKVEAHLAEHWDEDMGDVLWWDFPVEEPPYCGTPLDEHFPKYKTHFSMIDMPNEIEKPKQWVVKLPNDYYFSSWVSPYSLEADGAAYKFYDDVFVFDDRKKAEAVATLVEGSVEEI